MSALLGLDVLAVDTAREAVRGADILATCTDSLHPVVEADWLEPGMHVVNIGPMDLGPAAEARIDVAVRQGTETWPMPESEIFRKGIGHSRGAFVTGTAEEQKRLPAASARHGAAPRGVFYGDIIAGRVPGRTGAAQITHYRPVGNWGVQFSSVGALVYRTAKAAGLGRALPTEWFLQDIKN
jgi:ornithine cyclodeaminase/alanine dehydrogenase-like protein (mu-crystallin family)